MNVEQHEANLRAECREWLRAIERDGAVDYHLPAFLPDGDGVVVVAERDPDGWFLTDRGDAVRYLEDANVEWETNTRLWAAVDGARMYGVKFEDGVLVKHIGDEPTLLDLVQFVQAVTVVAGVEWVGQQRERGPQYRTRTDELFRTIIRHPGRHLVTGYRHPSDRRVGAFEVDHAALVEGRVGVATWVVGNPSSADTAVARASGWKTSDDVQLGRVAKSRLVLVSSGLTLTRAVTGRLTETADHVIRWEQGDPDDQVRDFLAEAGVGVT